MLIATLGKAQVCVRDGGQVDIVKYAIRSLEYKREQYYSTTSIHLRIPRPKVTESLHASIQVPMTSSTSSDSELTRKSVITFRALHNPSESHSTVARVPIIVILSACLPLPSRGCPGLGSVPIEFSCTTMSSESLAAFRKSAGNDLADLAEEHLKHE